MKYICLVLSFLSFTQLSKAQFGSNLTVGEVYDFDVGDVFHYKYAPGGNSTYYLIYHHYRRTVINKTYSQNADTVFYTFETNNYSTYQGPDVPDSMAIHPIYSFDKYYTHLDTNIIYGTEVLINTLDTHLLYQSDSISAMGGAYELYLSIYESPHCDSTSLNINSDAQYGISINKNYTNQFAKGLGLISQGISEWDGIELTETNSYYKQVYYKKASNECGTKNNLNLEDFNKQPLFYWLDQNVLNVQFEDEFDEKYTLRIIDQYGRLIIEKQAQGAWLQTDLSQLKPGVYFAVIELNSAKKMTFNFVVD